MMGKENEVPGPGALMTSSPRLASRSLDSFIPPQSSRSVSKASLSTAFTPGTTSASASSSKKGKTGFSLSHGEDENKERGNWSGKLDFLLSSIGLAVGLGNVWRFPYLCYRNGGGAFLIPYCIMLAFAGLPLLYFELALGQYTSLGPISVWRISPLFKGIGYGMLTVTFLASIYYNVIIAYVIFYFCASMTPEVPWKHCNNDWNTHLCTSFENASAMSANISLDIDKKPRSPAEEYWERYVLDMSPGIEYPGNIRWQLALCLLLAWIIVFLCLIKGIKTTGKVVYFTALFPYFVLFCLLIRGVTLPGCLEGIKFYIIPKFSKLKSARVWGQAAMQIFYSLGVSWGSMLTMSSYNRFHNNVYRDSIIIAVINCGTSVFAGFVIFSVLGFMSHEFHIPVENVAASGPGLAFIAYPAGISMMPGAPFWSAMFFFMLFTLGLDSQFAGIECIVSAFSDEFPDHVRPYKTYFTLFVCIILFMLGLPQVTQGGIYWMNLMDWYAVGFSLLILGFMEITVVSYVYGYNRFAKDIETMIGFKPNIYWRACWMAVTPISIVIIIIFYIVLYEPITYNEIQYPQWAEVLGWLTVCLSLIWVPIWMIIKLVKYVRECGGMSALGLQVFTLQTWRDLTMPSSNWGPALAQHRDLRENGPILTQPSDPDLTIDTIDYKVPFKFNNNGFAQSMSSMHSIRTEVSFESHV